jgi:hypothetical protein
MKTYHLGEATVQSVVVSDDWSFMVHFGRAAYCKTDKILSESLRTQAQPIVDQLNSGNLTEESARKQLKKIYM